MNTNPLLSGGCRESRTVVGDVGVLGDDIQERMLAAHHLVETNVLRPSDSRQ